MNKHYINQVIKHLKCSKKRKSEIRKQLLSEMEDASERELMNPVEVAEEFNQSFSEQEKKAYKKEKWTKRIGIALLFVLLLVGLVWWMVPRQILLKDSEHFQEEEVQAKAIQVIEYLDDSNYDALLEMSTDVVKEYLNADKMEEVKDLIGTDWGERESIGNMYGVEVKARGKIRAMVQVNMKYENEVVSYTVVFNDKLQLDGLWMK